MRMLSFVALYFHCHDGFIGITLRPCHLTLFQPFKGLMLPGQVPFALGLFVREVHVFPTHVVAQVGRLWEILVTYLTSEFSYLQVRYLYVLLKPPLPGKCLVAVWAKMCPFQMDVFLVLLQLNSGEEHLARTVWAFMLLLSPVDSLNMLVQTPLTVVHATAFCQNGAMLIFQHQILRVFSQVVQYLEIILFGFRACARLNNLSLEQELKNFLKKFNHSSEISIS